MTDYPRGHDMSEMGHLTLPGATAAYIAKLEARIAELANDVHTAALDRLQFTETIRRLSDENAALKALLADIGGGPVAIYGTDFPECSDVNMHGSGPENGEKLNNAKDIDQTSELVTRWRNGKRYELTPEDARRFDDGEE